MRSSKNQVRRLICALIGAVATGLFLILIVSNRNIEAAACLVIALASLAGGRLLVARATGEHTGDL